MSKNNERSFLRKKTEEIIASIDLFYILKEAAQKSYDVCLICGIFTDKLIWEDGAYNLSYNFNLSCGMIYNFIINNSNKIIKINISSDDEFPIDRNIIIYVPFEIDIYRIKKEYNSVVI